MVRSTAPVFILSSIMTSVLCCDWLTHRDLRNATMTLVRVMGGEFTKQKCPIPFPYKLYENMEKRQEESQLCFIRDNLKQIYDLYPHGNLTSAAWDPVKTREFQESINRQIEELESCVSTLKRRPDSRVKRFYRKLRNKTLNCTDGSSAYWELLRKETKHHLDRLDMLGNDILAASRGRSAAFQHL